MADFGMKVIRDNRKILNSENVLLKVHKHGAFKLRVTSGEGTLTIPFDDLGYRPIVLVYAQKRLEDGSLDPNYNFGDWRYDGATQQGRQETKIYNNRFTFFYSDTDPDVPAIIDLLGYYYIFKEEVNG
jgi:hypothetical protein